MAGIHAAFPGGRAPRRREDRIDVLEALLEAGLDDASDPFDALTARFHAIEAAVRESLVELARRNRGAFDLLPEARSEG